MNTFTKTCGHFGKPLCILLLLFLTNCRKDKNDPTANYPVLGKVELSEIKATSAKMACSITKVGVGADANSTIKEYGICYGTKEKPTIDDTKIKAGEKVDKPIEFSVVGSNLTAGSKFYVRGYVLHEGEPVYSEEAILTTANLKVPDVSTGSSENIISSAFSILGKITDIGTSDVSQHGHVLSESNQVPTTADAKIELGAANSAKDFKSGFAGLKANTTYYVRAYATNATGTGYGTVATVKTANEVPPTVTTGAVSNVSQSQVTVAGKLTDNGTQAVFQTGHCISEANQEPTIADSKTELGSGSAPKDFVTTFLGLNPNKTYYIRAYARSSVGASYGAVVSFKTPNVEPPTVTTTDGTDMTVSSFNAAGRVTAIGTADVTQYGHLISETNQNPTTADKNAQTQMGSTNAPKDFKSAFTNLKSNTTYYLRAYATSPVGTAYSESKTVKTANEVIPTVTTAGAVYNLTVSSFTIDGSITNTGTKPITEYGHCYNKTGNPTIADTKTNKGATNQNIKFTSDYKGLESNTTYHVRAYAKSDAGVGYGDVRQFKTLELVAPVLSTVGLVGDKICDGTAYSATNENPFYVDICKGSGAVSEPIVVRFNFSQRTEQIVKAGICVGLILTKNGSFIEPTITGNKIESGGVGAVTSNGFFQASFNLLTKTGRTKVVNCGACAPPPKPGDPPNLGTGLCGNQTSTEYQYRHLFIPLSAKIRLFRPYVITASGTVYYGEGVIIEFVQTCKGPG